MPVWSPDGQMIAFSSDRHGPASLYRRRSASVGEDQRLTQAPHVQFPTAYTADGRLLLYSEMHPVMGSDLWALPLGGDRRPQPLLRTEFNEYQAQLSPDGKFIAYISDESSRYEVYLAKPKRYGQSMAGLQERGTAAAMAPRRERIVLRCSRRRLNGGRCRCSRNRRSQNTSAPAVPQRRAPSSSAIRISL